MALVRFGVIGTGREAGGAVAAVDHPATVADRAVSHAARREAGRGPFRCGRGRRGRHR